MNELDIINIIKNTLSNNSLIGDDTACLEDLGITITQDSLIEDVHFRTSTISPYQLGKKSIAVNLSDIASSGARAKYLMISLSLPQNTQESFVKEFYQGVDSMCKEFNLSVAGGDITGSDKISISICAIGINNGITQAKRSNAKQGDIIFTTGVHGSSFAGFLALENKISVPQKLINAHLSPIPLLETGRKIVSTVKNACLMDSSDGLGDALFKISSSSNLTAHVDMSLVPFDEEMKEFAQKLNQNYKNWILFGAEDYQLVGTADKKSFENLQKQGLHLYQIGYMTEKKEHYVCIKDNNTFLTLDEEDIKHRCFNHFEERENT